MRAMTSGDKLYVVFFVCVLLAILGTEGIRAWRARAAVECTCPPPR